MRNKNILVVGSGVSGLTSALALLRADHNVTIWSKEPAGTFPNTSLSAYAMWVPVTIPGDDRVERWTNETRVELTKLAADQATGIELRPVVVLKPEHSEPWFAGKVEGFRHGTSADFSDEYADAHIVDNSPVIDPEKYLPWLLKQVTDAGGILVQNTVASFDSVPAEFDVVVNCAGLGARALTSDPTLFPDRVQVVKIRHNGLDRVVIDDEGASKRACIVPHAGYIKIGGVFDGAANEDLTVDDAATADILARCAKMVPGFKCAPEDVISVHRALRPERSSWIPRVEKEALADGRFVVHNYGHDGMGYLTSHGIAADVVSLVGA